MPKTNPMTTTRTSRLANSFWFVRWDKNTTEKPEFRPRLKMHLPALPSIQSSSLLLSGFVLFFGIIVGFSVGACCTKRGGEIILSASQAFVINAGLIESITHSWTPGSEELLELFESSNNYWSFPCDVDVTLNLVTVAISSKNGQLHHSCWRTTTRTEKNRIGPELNNISLHKSVLSFFLPTL